MKILITGIASKFGRLVAELLVQHGHEVLGIDRRPWPDAPKGVTMFNADIRKRPAEDVFRTRRPDAVVHLATVTHFSASADERHRINLGGTRAIFAHCHNYGVKQAVFVGRHTFYGAAPDSPLYHTEDEPPMGVNTFPELGDLVAADLYAASALWRHPEIDTVVLRLCYILGPSQQGTLASYLAGPRVPTVLGFDPLYQFIHEYDGAEAIRLALEARLRGVYNVTGPQPVPLSLLIRQTGRTEVPLPEPVLKHALGRFGFPSLPPGAVSHIKYSIVVDGQAFKEAVGFDHRFDEIQTMEAFRWA